MAEAKIFAVSSLVDIFPNTPAGDQTSYDLHLAQNEGESFQVAVTAGDQDLTLSASAVLEGEGFTCLVRPVGLLPFTQNTIHISPAMLRAKGPGVLPEVLYDNPTFTVPAGESRSVCITVYSEKDAKPGSFSGEVTLKGEGFEGKLPFTVTLYPVCLPDSGKSDFSYVCWTQFLYKTYLEQVYGLERESEAYWQYVKNCAKIMKRQRQNVVDLNLEWIFTDHIDIDDDGTCHFDFSFFDQFMEVMLDPEYLGAKMITGMHLLSRDWCFDRTPNCGWNQRPLIGWVFEKNKDGKVEVAWKMGSDPALYAFHRQLFGALGEHLREKGWEDIWVQHVADEIDNDIHYQHTLSIYQLVHELMPTARTIDAVRRQSVHTFGGELDIHVPLMWHHDLAPQSYAELQAAGTEVWYYTCLQPQFDYLSRLGDYPLLSTRLLNWYSYRHHLTGFLHYAWHLYDCCAERQNPYANLTCFGSFPCDAFIVYPDKENLTVLESLRSEAQRDTNEDFELLCLAAKKDKETVERLVQMVIRRADDVLFDADFILQLRIELLKLASGMLD